jgi:hypothetical protein
MTLLQYVLTGLCAGAGMPVFGAAAVILWKLPATTAYYRNVQLSMIAGGLCLLCPIMVSLYLSLYSTMPRVLFVGCVAGGAAIGILVVYLYRWRRATGI